MVLVDQLWSLDPSLREVNNIKHTQAFILPAITHLRIFRNRLTKQNKIEDYTILVFGIIGTIIGSIDAAKRLGIIPIPEGEEISELP